MAKTIRKFLKDESGATAVEYGLIASLIVIGMLFGMRAFSSAVNGMFDYISNGVLSV